MLRLKFGSAQSMILAALLCSAAVTPCAASELPFSEQAIDTVGPVAPWAKGVADINQDGLADVLIGGHRPRAFSFLERIANKLGLSDIARERGELVWYEAPHWRRHVISTSFAVRTDVEAGDLDGDGDIDVVALTDSGVYWFEAPGWQPHRIDERKFHDVELAQINTTQDARPDLVLRNQSLFGYGNGDALEVLLSAAEGQWQRVGLDAPQGEGLQVIEGKRVAIIVNDAMFTAPAQEQVGNAAAWRKTRYTTAAWSWPHVVVAAADFNADGRLDVALAPAEEKGQRYRLSWFEAPANTIDPWREHVILADTEAVHHALVAADFDGDGHIDLATARMTQGDDPDAVLLLRNSGNGEAFTSQVLSTDGSHNLHVVDADGDFDPDLVGANWQKDNFDGDYPVTLWRNDRATSLWPRHVIDDARPGQAVNVLPADLDGDGLVDVVTGACWYQNPGTLDKSWQRRELGSGRGNALLTIDLDADDTLDVLSTAWSGYSTPTLMARLKAKVGLGPDPWQKQGNTLIVHFNPASTDAQSTVVAQSLPGDWPHGTTTATDNGRVSVSLSMHGPNTPVVTLAVPEDAASGDWDVISESPHSQNEALSAVDVDLDGRMDLVTGTQWIDGSTGDVHQIGMSTTVPDRHVVIPARVNQPLQVVVGDEAISRAGRITLYSYATGTWTAQPVGVLTGPMSLDVGDIDLDGDVDIVAGEHNLDDPSRARLVWFERRAHVWVPHLIGRGDEHHDGAQLADFDGDGDLDVVSIGWGHGRVLMYENPRRSP